MAYILRNVAKGGFYPYIEDFYRIEFTVTYKSRYMPGIEYANSLNNDVMIRIINFVEANIEGEWGYVNYVVENQQNGYPHLHGTIFTENIIRPNSVHNLEKALYRLYGSSQLYCTGKRDYHHKNDHFEGGWQDYLHKEKIPVYISLEKDPRYFNYRAQQKKTKKSKVEIIREVLNCEPDINIEINPVDYLEL